MSLALVRRWALGFYVRQKSPSPQPSPGGRGSRPRCLALCIDLDERVDYGFLMLMHRGRRAPHPSPLPEGEGADRGVLRYTSTWKTLAAMALLGFSDAGFRAIRSGRRISRISPYRFPLPRERARVRGFLAVTTGSPVWPTAAHPGCDQILGFQS